MNRKEAWKLVEEKADRLYTGAALALLRVILKAATVRKGKAIDNEADVERTLTLRLDALKRSIKSESTFYFAMDKLERDGVVRDRQTIEHNRKRPEVRLTLCLDKLKELEDLPTMKEKLQGRTAKATAIRTKQREDAKKARIGLLNCLAGCCPRFATEQPAAA